MHKPGNDLGFAQLRDETTRQWSTFDVDRRTKTVPVARGEKKVLGEVEGTGYIANMWLTFPGWFWQHWNTGAPISQTILKTFLIRLYWDGAARPAVEAPMSDFFGMGLGQAANFASRYFGLSSGGFFCKFPMPFRKGFRIEVENLDAEIDTDVFMNVLYQETDALPSGAGWFHCQFHTGRNPGPEPLEVAHFEGRGRYAGIALAMQGRDPNYLSFLEAPEYIYVDEDWERPRMAGTGLEDYFLGGWYFREGPFAGPYHGVPVKDSLRASIAMYRTHEEDAIHFQRRFRMAFVNPWEPDRLMPYAYASAVYAYLDSPEGQGQGIGGREALLPWYRINDSDHQSIP